MAVGADQQTPPRPVGALPIGAPPRDAAAMVDSGFVDLGERLFFSRALSSDGSVSCASCHPPALGFSGDRARPVGAAGFLARRRAPPVVGLAARAPLMWDGAAAGLAEQVRLPLGAEMGTDWPTALRRLNGDAETTRLASAAGVAGPIDDGHVARALAAYVDSLDAGGSRFDRYFYGGERDALTDREIQGLGLFLRRGRCASCHLVDGRGAPFTDGGFHALGVGWRGGAYADRGRFGVTGDPKDDGAFKTPGLRNVALRPVLMHDGSVASLREAVELYDRGGVAGAPNRDERLRPLFLGPAEVDALVAFLGALTSEVVSLRPPPAAPPSAPATGRGAAPADR